MNERAGKPFARQPTSLKRTKVTSGARAAWKSRASKVTDDIYAVLSESIDWSEIGDLVCSVLVCIQENRETFEQHARHEGVVVEQLSAAAITELVREQIEGVVAHKTANRDASP